MPPRQHQDSELNAVGDMIRRLRENAGMTQVELAYQVGTSPRTVQRWEQRDEGTKPDAVDLLKVLAVFGIEVPEAPRYQAIAHELERIHDRLDELAGTGRAAEAVELARQLSESTFPTADVLEGIVAELSASTPPSPRRLAQMRAVVDEFAQAARLSSRLAAALRSRLEAAASGS